jgi:quinol monooxygenase YgiN
MIGFEILVRVHPKKRTEFLQAFDMLKTVDQQADNRLELELFERINKPNTFLWLEHWDNDEALFHYCEDNRYRAMLGAIDILGQLVHRRTFSIKGDTENEKASVGIA